MLCWVCLNTVTICSWLCCACVQFSVQFSNDMPAVCRGAVVICAVLLPGRWLVGSASVLCRCRCCWAMSGAVCTMGRCMQLAALQVGKAAGQYARAQNTTTLGFRSSTCTAHLVQH
jgi:hypothetical protein